jgi:hypothetical protein
MATDAPSRRTVQQASAADAWAVMADAIASAVQRKRRGHSGIDGKERATLRRRVPAPRCASRVTPLSDRSALRYATVTGARPGSGPAVRALRRSER